MGLVWNEDAVKSGYLKALPEMMENLAIWETIKDRSAADKDSFLSDRFRASCRRCYDAINSGATHTEWLESAKLVQIEPDLANYAYKTVTGMTTP